MTKKKTIIRKAHRNDLEVLNTISVASKKHWGYPDEWMSHWMDDLKISEADIENHGIHVLEVEGKTIGFSMIVETPEAYELKHLWLVPDAIGLGYGKLLLNTALNGVEKPNKKVLLTADPNVEAFYRSQGFKTIGQAESFPKGRFLPIMAKALWLSSPIISHKNDIKVKQALEEKIK